MSSQHCPSTVMGPLTSNSNKAMKAKQINKWFELTWARNLSQPAGHIMS